MNQSIQIACHECDLLVDLASMDEGTKALCPRCGYILTSLHSNAPSRVIAFSSSALLFLTIACLFPFLTFSAQGQDRTVTLFQSIAILAAERFPLLSVLLFLFIVIFPFLLMLCLLYVYTSINTHAIYPGTKALLKIIVFLQPWSMAEIFLVAILVSFIKIASLAAVFLGISFWSYVLFVISMTLAILHVDKHQAWKLFRYGYDLSKKIEAGHHASCHICTGVLPLEVDYCGVCESEVHGRKTSSLQKTWALLFTSVLFYIPANFLPIMKTTFLGKETENTLLGGIIVLWSHGSYPIATIIFVASVFIPLGKIIALAWLCLSINQSEGNLLLQKTRLYRLTEFVGRWSMIDVFVVAVLVALIQLGDVMSIHPDWGAVAFAGLVICTVIAADSFDPRLMWDQQKKENALCLTRK